MKVAFLSESTADEAAIRILVEAVLGQPTQHVPIAGIRAGGWGAVHSKLPAVYKALYFHTDAEALVIVADSDDSPMHAPAHEEAGGHDSSCRLCLLRRTIEDIRKHLTPMPNRGPLRTAIGLAVPAIEAWFLAGVDIHVTELAWSRGIGQRTFDRASLKRDLYGDRAPLAVVRAKMIESASQVSQDLSRLESRFPIGFGALLRDIRGWSS